MTEQGGREGCIRGQEGREGRQEGGGIGRRMGARWERFLGRIRVLLYPSHRPTLLSPPLLYPFYLRLRYFFAGEAVLLNQGVFPPRGEFHCLG